MKKSYINLTDFKKIFGFILFASILFPSLGNAQCDGDAGVISGAITACVGAEVELTITDNVVPGVWSVDANATIDQDGKLTITNAGTINVAYTVDNGGCIDVAAYVVTAKALPDAGIISGDATVCIDSIIELSSTVAGGVWAVDANGIIDIDGKLAATDEGTINVSYTVTENGCENVATYTVTAIVSPDAGVISGDTALCIGSEMELTATVAGGVWEVDANGIIDIDGKLTATSEGVINVMYIVGNGNCVDTATFVVNAVDLPNAGVLSLDPTICIGSEVILSSTVEGGVWAVDANATITKDTVLKATKVGMIHLTYTVTENGCANVALDSMEVLPLPVAPVITGESSICVYSTDKIALTADTINGVWSSSADSIATIDQNGVITHTNYGVTTISYTVTENGCSKAGTKKITIEQYGEFTFNTAKLASVTEECAITSLTAPKGVDLCSGKEITASTNTEFPITTVGGTVVTWYYDVEGKTHYQSQMVYVNLPDNGVTKVNSTTMKANASGKNYQWINCESGLPVEGATGQTFTATEIGRYAVQVYTNDSCYVSSECVNIWTLSTEDMNALSWNVYPNPSKTGKYTVSTAQNTAKVEVVVYNALGQKVYAQNLGGGNQFTIDLSNQSKGVYIATINGTQNLRLIRD